MDIHVTSDGTIGAIRPTGKSESPPVPVLNGRGAIVLPGYVDLHTHILRYPECLSDLIRWGITGIREAGTAWEAIARVRSRADIAVLPRFAAAGPLIDGDPPRWPRISVVVRSVADIEAVLDAHVAHGVRWVKAYRRLTASLLRTLIQASHARNLRVMAHLGRVPVRDAIAWGLDSLEHIRFGTVDRLLPRKWAVRVDRLPWPERDFAFWAAVNIQHDRLRRIFDAMAARGTIWVPTIVVHGVAVQSASPGERHMPTWMRRKWAARSYRMAPDRRQKYRSVLHKILGVVRLAHRHGVVLGVGTDVPNVHTPPGWSFHWELSWLARAGLPLAEIVRAACWTPYRILEWPTPLQPGSPADLVILRTRHLRSVRDLRRIGCVIRTGRVVFCHPRWIGAIPEGIPLGWGEHPL